MVRQPRVRDYRAEEAARNARAQARGFRNRYEERLLRAGGQLPSAASVKTDKNAARRDRELTTAKRAGLSSYKEYLSARKEAQKWSDAHSRQPVSQYNPRWSPETFGHYYHGLVEPWGEKRKAYALANRKAYIVDDAHHMTEEQYDDDPRY